MRIEIDRTKCQGIGICESLRPDLFEFDDANDMTVDNDAITDDDETRIDLQEAVDACPTLALTLTD